MLQDWQLCKENLVPSQDLFDKELYNVSIHFNPAEEICANWLLLPTSSPTITTINTTTPIPTTTFTSIKTTSVYILFMFTPTPISCTSALTITTPTSTMSVLLITTSSLTSTTSASTFQRPKVAFVEDDKESDSELSSYGRFVGISEVPALPVSEISVMLVSEVPLLPDMERLSRAELKKQ